ncbi:MAG: hypothetical protein WKF84_15325 [Pyrinomonadaceae bacterium]
MNNGYLGMVRQWQEMFYDRAYSEVDLSVVARLRQARRSLRRRRLSRDAPRRATRCPRSGPLTTRASPSSTSLFQKKKTSSRSCPPAATRGT